MALQVNDRALSKRERGRSRFPHREPIGRHPRARVDRTLLEREGNDPAASPYLKATDCARNPKNVFHVGTNQILNGDPSIPASLQRPLFVGRNTLRAPLTAELNVR